LLDGLSEERRRRFFTISHGSYCVTKEIRDLCTFSVHNLIRDPPFSMMSLVSCRNLLIYMNPDLQAQIIPVFHYALVAGGTLLLGGSESVAHHADLFETVDKAARIFQRREGRSPELNLRWQHPHLTPQLLQGPPDEHIRDVPHSSPFTERHAMSMNRRSAEGGTFSRTQRFEPLLGPVVPSAESVAQLQIALRSAVEQLQSLAEEHQTALEELRSANEELHSVNEEMQSTNEELETSKEELQSLNEELHTVNLRLSEKIDELDEANSDLRNLFDSTEIATVFLDRHLVIRSFTTAIATIYNLIPSDQGRPLTDIVSHLRYRGLRADIAFVLSTLEPLERRVERDDDDSVNYIMRILPYREPDSTVSGVLITFVDVSSIVRAEKALVEADIRKDVFLATLSHELRNPLAPIRTAAQLLQSPKLSADQLHYAQAVIARQVAHMSSLLEDLLDVSRITRGSFLLKKEYVDLQVLIDDAVVAVQPGINAKQHTLRVEHLSTPIQLEVDPVRMTQVITNLLTNASKYTPNGGLIYIGARTDANHLAIYVRDNGVGIKAEALLKVFEMFTRVEPEVGRSEGGLGIGLALAKGIVDLHGGRIEAHSAGPKQGSEFVICLPRALIVSTTVSAPERDREAANPTIPRRILIADDNRDSAQTMSMLLQLAGHEVHLAHTGTEALEVARRIRPDIGILDIGMPDLTGYEVAERIRHEAWGKDITLVAVTGWGQSADKRRALATGFDHHLTKPVDPEILERLFEV
jgi:two-component system, chemotaxis family, CheB/CheR fusion protein